MPPNLDTLRLTFISPQFDSPTAAGAPTKPMGRDNAVRREFFSGPLVNAPSDHIRPLVPITADLEWPFETLDGLGPDDIRETAYEVFFTACRSSPGFGGRSALAAYYTAFQENSNQANGVGKAPTSQVKRALGLKIQKRTHQKKVGFGSFSGSLILADENNHVEVRPRRPLTSAEIMRQQMRVTEQSDDRLRKTLMMRTVGGKMGKRAETIIVPLELLRHLKPSEFNDSNEYHTWQKRQLKTLETGLLLHPSVPLDNSNPYAVRLRDIIDSSELEPIDVGKDSDTMRTLLNSVTSLAWRSANGTPTDVCHWADGYPFNIHLYIVLLQSIFDIRDETSVLDEVDELLELIKKTWSTLGINQPIHNVCLTWVLFHQYIATSQLEPDLLGAAHAMLAEVLADAKRPNRDPLFLKITSSVLASIKKWSDKRLLSYHDYFQKGTMSVIENLLPLALTASGIIDILNGGELQDKGEKSVNPQGNHVVGFIRSSLKHAFKKVIEGQNIGCDFDDMHQSSKALLRLAEEAEALALNEKENFSPILKKWHGIAPGIAAVTLHSCYGAVLKHYLTCTSRLSPETMEVLNRSGKLEKVLIQIAVEDSVECEDGGQTIAREMVPYKVDSIIVGLVRRWIDERMQQCKHCLDKAKAAETWNPISKPEPHARSATEVMALVKATVHDFFEIPVDITEDLVKDLADSLQQIFEDYIALISSCGTKQNYLPVIPPLARCHKDSKFLKLCKRVTPCGIVLEDTVPVYVQQGKDDLLSRPNTSLGTQRLYIRLNTLHYLLSQINSLDKTLLISHRESTTSSYFDASRLSIAAACQLVSEVAAYRLTFLDSNTTFFESLYAGDVTNSRIKPVLHLIKQNLSMLCEMLADRAQAMAITDVMRSSFEAFLMVLLAGSQSRVFYRSDYERIEDDFQKLKNMFSTCGEGLIAEDVREKEAEIVEGIIELMGASTEQLIKEYDVMMAEISRKDKSYSGHKFPMAPTTGKWCRTDPHTILRVLCHRVDRTADQYLKRSLQLGKK